MPPTHQPPSALTVICLGPCRTDGSSVSQAPRGGTPLPFKSPPNWPEGCSEAAARPTWPTVEGKGEPHLLEEGMRPREGKGLGHHHTASEQLCPQVGVTPGFVLPRLQHVEEAGCIRQQKWEPQPLGCKSEGLGEEKGLRTVMRCGCVPPAGRGC